MSAPTDRLGARAMAAALLCGALSAQTPTLHAAVAASEHRGGAPAIAWLCEEFLPTLPAWPEGLDPADAFALTVSPNGVDVRATEVAVPGGLVALGTVTLAESSQEPALVWSCGHDGGERWRIPASFAAPAAWGEALAAIGADAVSTPRTVAAPVLAGHLSGGLLEGDPRAALLRIGPALCGDVTWLATRQGDETIVDGRSGGGLMLPLALFLIAVADGAASPSALQLRAFAARDGDRGEAARQLGRSDRALDVETLRALLHGQDELRLTAIRSLTQRGALDALPQIVDAATPDMPWSTLAARDALRALWPHADAAQRRETQAALQRNRCPELRGVLLDAGAAPGRRAVDRTATGSARGRAFAALFCTGIGLLGLWRRERLRAQPARRPSLS